MPLAHVPVTANVLAHARAIAPPSRIPADLRFRVQRELRRPGRYRLTEPTIARHRNWLQVAIGWVRGRWMAMLNALAMHVRVGRSGERLAGYALLLLFVLIAGALAARALRAVQWRNDRAATGIGFEPQRNAHALFVQAQAAADRADFTSAVRLLFSASVTLLDLRGVVQDDASATVNDLRGALACRDAAIANPFVAIAEAYTAAAYAEMPVDLHAWAAAARAYEALARAAVLS